MKQQKQKQKKQSGVFRTILEATIIILIILAAFNISNSIYVNPGDAIQYQIDTPLETYVFENPYNISGIIRASTYIVFNNTGFNITSTNPITIQINHIDEDISNPSDDNDNLLVFTITNTPGATWFNLSGFEPVSGYIVKINDVFSSGELANSTGSISFYDTPDANDVYSIFLESTAPSITINFAGNLSDSGGPYYLPPAESPPHAEDGYYTNDSRQSEGWMYINLTVEDAGGVPNVWLQWLNETTWTNYTYAFLNTTGGYFEFNTSGNLSTAEGYNYSFNIVANDTSSNSKTVWWNKTAMYGNFGANPITRRYVQLNCSTTDISYTPLYIIKINETHADAQDDYKMDRLHHDQGTDGTSDDTGYLRIFVPDDTVQNIYCTGYVGAWFDESLSIEPFTLDSIYYHIWFSTDSNYLDELGWYKSRQQLSLDGITEEYSAAKTDNRSEIYYDGGTAYDTYYLTTNLLDVTNTPFTDNNIYEFLIKARGSIDYPSIINNRSFTSFVLFNVPDDIWDGTDNSTDTDSDGISDHMELNTTYGTHTNPFLADTDNDSVNDYNEYMSGSDPNNYTDTIACGNSPPSFSTPTPANNSIDQPVSLTWQITITDSDSDLFNWTIECNNSQTDSGNDESNGAKQLSFSGNINTKYTVWVNATDGNDNSGNWTNHTYYFTTTGGSPAVISNPSPNNGSTGVSVSLASVSITIEDPEGINFDWYITTSPNVGSDSGSGESNGSKTCSISGLSYEATYTWYVKVWDTVYWTNRSYYFTVESSGPGPPPNTAPVITSPYPEDSSTLQVTTPYCHIYVADADNDPITINFYNSTDSISWTWQQTNDSVSTGTTVYWDYTQASEYNTIYYWKVTADDAVINVSETYSFTTIQDNPVISSHSPSNNTIDVTRNTSVSVTIFDYQGDTMNITWRSNSSGSWLDFGWNISISNGTFSQRFINSTGHNTQYWWSVNVSDGTDWTNETYSFVTEVGTVPVISDPIPRNGRQLVSIYLTNISVVIDDVNNDFNYTIETSPDIGSISEGGVASGVKTCIVSGLAYSTTYTWYVNSTNGVSWTNVSYTFTTKGATDFDIEDFKLNLPEWAMGPFKVYVGDFVWMFLFVGVIAITWGSSKHISSVFIVILLTFAAYGTQRVFVDNSEISLLFSIIAAICIAAIMLGLFLKKRHG